MKTFFVKPKIYYGRNSLAFLSTLDVNRVCIVTDKMMVKLGVADKIKSYVTHTVCTIFDEVEPNPSLDTVKKALAIFLDDGPDVMIAVGGGSPIDAAKAILYLSDEISKQIPFKRPLFIAVPTTSGTGSEVTSYSVVTDTERNIKIPFTDERMMPDIAILDEELTKTVPPTVTADTGMDVLTHAIEAYVTRDANEFTDMYAEKAIQAVFTYLPRVYRFGGDMEARGQMHLASCMAGIAFNNSGLGINHSLAHALGALFGLSHGRANAILLPYVIQFNAGLCDGTAAISPAAKKYASIAKMLGLPCSSTEEGVISLVAAVKYLQKVLDIPETLAAAGVDRKELDDCMSFIIKSAREDVCTAGNPKEVRPIDFTHLLNWVYEGDQ